MRNVFKGLVVVSAAALLCGSARAEAPNFNKRGTTEAEQKAFAKDVAQTIVKAARSSAKDITLQEHKLKDGKEGRMELTLSAGYKGAVLGTKYSADIVVHLDTSTKDKWEVLRIEYKDNNKSPVPYSNKDVDALVNTFNGAK
jgi:hypothetical protein